MVWISSEKMNPIWFENDGRGIYLRRDFFNKIRRAPFIDSSLELSRLEGLTMWIINLHYMLHLRHTIFWVLFAIFIKMYIIWWNKRIQCAVALCWVYLNFHFFFIHSCGFSIVHSPLYDYAEMIYISALSNYHGFWLLFIVWELSALIDYILILLFAVMLMLFSMKECYGFFVVFVRTQRKWKKLHLKSTRFYG